MIASNHETRSAGSTAVPSNHAVRSGASGQQRVAVLGAGLLGCSLALELARRGCRVDLFDRANRPMTGAALVNEGKLHLGFLWAKDPSLATARLMAEGSLQFFPLLRRWLGGAADDLPISSPFIYAVPHDSMLPPDQVLDHISRIDALIRAIEVEIGVAGDDPDAPARNRAIAACHAEPLSRADLEASFAPDRIAAAARTPEISVHPAAVAALVQQAIAAEPSIAFHPAHNVERVEVGSAGCEVLVKGQRAATFDAAVNALWDGRLAVDTASGLAPDGPWRWRTKYSLRIPVALGDYGIPSVTMVLGPFGDFADYRNGESLLSWYPAGLMGIEDGIEPPIAWSAPSTERVATIRHETIAALAVRCPAISCLPDAAIATARLVGGPIFAAGASDITDPESGLHERTRVGIRSIGRYHSVDPGKYCLAPLMAMRVADIIAEDDP